MLSVGQNVRLSWRTQQETHEAAGKITAFACSDRQASAFVSQSTDLILIRLSALFDDALNEFGR